MWYHKIYYKPTVIKIVWYWWKNRNLNQWKRSDFGNRCKHIWSIDFWQGSQATEWWKEKPSPNSARTIGHLHAKIQNKRISTNPYHITSNPEPKMYHRPKCKTLNFYCDFGLGKKNLIRYKAQTVKEINWRNWILSN